MSAPQIVARAVGRHRTWSGTLAETGVLVNMTGLLGPSGVSRLVPVGPMRVFDICSDFRSPAPGHAPGILVFAF